MAPYNYFVFTENIYCNLRANGLLLKITKK